MPVSAPACLVAVNLMCASVAGVLLKWCWLVSAGNPAHPAEAGPPGGGLVHLPQGWAHSSCKERWAVRGGLGIVVSMQSQSLTGAQLQQAGCPLGCQMRSQTETLLTGTVGMGRCEADVPAAHLQWAHRAWRGEACQSRGSAQVRPRDHWAAHAHVPQSNYSPFPLKCCRKVPQGACACLMRSLLPC